MREKGRLLGALDHLSFDWAERIRNQGGEAAEAWMWQVGGEQGGRSVSATREGRRRRRGCGRCGGSRAGEVSMGARGLYKPADCMIHQAELLQPRTHQSPIPSPLPLS